jgi:hypothetical protein
VGEMLSKIIEEKNKQTLANLKNCMILKIPKNGFWLIPVYSIIILEREFIKGI